LKKKPKKSVPQKKVAAAPAKHVMPKPVPVPVIGKEFRPWVVWIWNLSITKKEALSQLSFFIEQGFGGIAIKIGRNMSPAFLSDEFFAIFNAVLQQAQKESIGIRFMEDFSMPVHGEFNAIALKNSTIRAQSLVLEFTEQIQNRPLYEKVIDDPSTAIVQVAKVENDRIMVSKNKTVSIHKDNPVLTWKQPQGVYQIMVFRKKMVSDPLFGYSPNAFRELTAKLYTDTVWAAFHKQCAKYMPSTFEGFISELPAPLPCDNSIPWDDDLVVKYRSKYKKELISVLPSLFFSCEIQEIRNRAHIYTFINQSMHERFTSFLDKWSKKYRLSNWILCAERTSAKTSSMLRDCMFVPPEGFGVVGIQNQEGSDENTAILHAIADSNIREFKRDTVTIIGRNRTGQAATIQSLKAEIDSNTAIGSSRILIDGSFFNIDNRSFIKTPTNPSWYAPGAETIKELCNYAARVKKLTAQRQLTRQVAILLPTQSVMTDYIASNDAAVSKATVAINQVANEVSALSLDYDVITEEMLLTCSLFTTGEFNTQNKVRKGNYQALVIPYSRLVSKNLFVFIERMISKKGTVIFIDEAPHGTIDDGITPTFTARVAKILRSKTGTAVVTQAKDIELVLGRFKPSASVTVQGRKCADLLLTIGSTGNQAQYAIRNKSDTQDYFATIEMPEEKYYYVSDCTTGETHEITDVQRKEDTCKINLNMSPRQTYYIVATSQKQTTTILPKGVKPTVNVIGTVQRNYRIVMKDQWQFTPESLNVLPLATWNTRIGLSRESGGFSHFYESYFEIKELPNVLVFCISEQNGVLDKADRTLEVTVNGNRVYEANQGHFSAAVPASVAPATPVLDGLGIAAVPEPVEQPCFKMFTKNTLSFNIRDNIRKGVNRISLRTHGVVFDPPALTYPPLIAGNFCLVKSANGLVIDTTMPTVSFDSWTKYGFPYMSGCGTYKQVFEIPTEFNRLVLKFSQVSGCTSVTLNEKKLSDFNWQPMEIDITDICSTKRNDLTVTVVNTIDNILRMNNRSSGIIGEVYLDVY